MRKKLIAGNWKMNGTQASVNSLLQGLVEGVAELDELNADDAVVDVVVFPPALYLAQVAQELSNTPIMWGAQCVSEHASGAYTGQISLDMLEDISCAYVLIGHSERRQFNAESDEMLAKQFAHCFDSSIIPVLCVGESLAEREAGNREAVITRQVQACVNAQTVDNAFVIAYEPVWAIGTGKTASPSQVQEVHALIRQLLANIEISLANTTQILYGGSVKPDNAAQLMSLNDVDGVLVGGCSLHHEQFLSIIHSQVTV